MMRDADDATTIGCTLFMLVMGAAWATHVIVTIVRHEWLLLIAGAVAFPVGIIHGFGIWLGIW